MLGRSHRFLGITSTFGGVNDTRTQHGFTRVGLEPPTSGSGVRGIKYQANALPLSSNMFDLRSKKREVEIPDERNSIKRIQVPVEETHGWRGFVQVELYRRNPL